MVFLLFYFILLLVPSISSFKSNDIMPKKKRRNDCTCVDTGDMLDCLKEMNKWRYIFYDYHMDNYKHYLKSKNTAINVTFTGGSMDGYTADMIITGEVLGLFVQHLIS
eukprot:362076_1